MIKMPSITSLPTEITLQILKDNGLTPTDLANCAQTCHRFRDVFATYSKDFKIDYTFQVDHTSQSGWKLIRCLLLDPALGDRIQSLKITWHRRRRQDKSTWTLKWHWTDDELSQILAVCEKWKLKESSYGAIKFGLNSEALLPLLLCYTLNLESLDVGDVAPDMISDEYGHTIFDANQMYNHCMGLTDADADEGSQLGNNEPIEVRTGVINNLHANLKGWYESGGALYSARGKLREPITNTPWIYSTFESKSWLPGLSNVKEFSHGGSNSSALRYRPQSLNNWPNQNLPKLLELPQLETLKLSHINALMGTPIYIKYKPVHKLKRLEIFHYRFYRSDFEAVARVTGGSLESVECILSDENFTPWDMSPEEKLLIITETFQDNSKDTLARDQISVTRSFKPFFDDFKYDSREDRALLERLYPEGSGWSQYDEYGGEWNGEDDGDEFSQEQ
ncbi:hypothetical protein TWF281_001813 [Arthrobotrys megalospora]